VKASLQLASATEIFTRGKSGLRRQAIKSQSTYPKSQAIKSAMNQIIIDQEMVELSQAKIPLVAVGNS
jgi:hypothetical protein